MKLNAVILCSSFEYNLHMLTVTVLSPRLAAICMVNHRGRQNIRKSLSPAHLSAYRSSMMKRQGDRITIDDVKRKCRYVVEHSDNNTAGLNQLILFVSEV